MNTQPAIDWTAVRRDFLLAPDEIYLNSGTFSALPRPVLAELCALTQSAEANPTRLAAWRRRQPFWQAQAAIAEYVGADPRDLALQVNVTEALSHVLLGSRWRPGGELLIGSREYPAIVNAACEAARRHGLSIRQLEFPQLAESAEHLTALVLDSVTDQTRGVLLSHIFSETGMLLPIEPIATGLRARGVRLIVDGAHGPGLVPLKLGKTDIDVYAGNLHKWFMGPKGTAFLYVRREVQEDIDPAIVGFGGSWRDGRKHLDPIEPSRFAGMFSPQGLRDYSSFLALPATLNYRQKLGEANILARIADLNRYTRERIGSLYPCLSPAPPLQAGLITFRLPSPDTATELQEKLFERYRITIAAWKLNDGEAILRLSPHIWNSEADIERLAAALTELMPAQK